jgi:hypothetical protein
MSEKASKPEAEKPVNPEVECSCRGVAQPGRASALGAESPPESGQNPATTTNGATFVLRRKPDRRRPENKLAAYKAARSRFVVDTIEIDGTPYARMSDPLTGVSVMVEPANARMLRWLFRGQWMNH